MDEQSNPESARFLGENIARKWSAGFTLAEKTPDYSEICKSRNTIDCNQVSKIFAEAKCQLEGKTTAMSVGFLLWAMLEFDGQVFAICGKTIESLRRNVITHLPTWLEGVVTIKERRNENKLVVTVNGRTNSVHLLPIE